MDKEIISAVKETPQILSTIYGDIAQPGVKKIGIALETVLEFSTSFLLPLKLMNEKIKFNFEKRLNDYKEKLNQIPEENLCDVNPQIGLPIIEKLTYITNDEIADLFTTLLSKASSINTVNLAHPNFIQILDRISVDEAKIIKYLNGKTYIPYVTFRMHLNKGFQDILSNGTLLRSQSDLFFPENINFYLNNLSSLGLLEKSHDNYLLDDLIYKPLLEEHKLEDMKKVVPMFEYYKSIEVIKGYFKITDLGQNFINACVNN